LAIECRQRQKIKNISNEIEKSAILKVIRVLKNDKNIEILSSTNTDPDK
jgi:hypothetical protein